jgi:dihydrofolate reductase
LKAIAAMSENGVIGLRNRIPWHIPEEFEWFKQTTMGQVILMGRRTFESIGPPLPGRRTLVLTRSDWSYPGVTVIHDLDDPELTRASPELFVCGGAQVYAQLLPRCSDLYLSHIQRTVEGDTFFPPFEHLFERAAIVLQRPEFLVVHYRRQKQ